MQISHDGFQEYPDYSPQWFDEPSTRRYVRRAAYTAKPRTLPATPCKDCHYGPPSLRFGYDARYDAEHYVVTLKPSPSRRGAEYHDGVGRTVVPARSPTEDSVRKDSSWAIRTARHITACSLDRVSSCKKCPRFKHIAGGTAELFSTITEEPSLEQEAKYDMQCLSSPRIFTSHRIQANVSPSVANTPSTAARSAYTLGLEECREGTSSFSVYASLPTSLVEPASPRASLSLSAPLFQQATEKAAAADALVEESI